MFVCNGKIIGTRKEYHYNTRPREISRISFGYRLVTFLVRSPRISIASKYFKTKKVHNMQTMNFGNLINPHKSVLHSEGDIRPTRKWYTTYFTSLLRGQIVTVVCTFHSFLKWIFASRNSRWNYFPLKILILTLSPIDLFCQENLVALGPKRSQFFFVCIASMGVA